jgi:tRNA U34 5-carboxymethylaminomethyl modifying GTPase MnmE/TrmE
LVAFDEAYHRGAEVAAEELRGAVREMAAISGHVTVDEDVLNVIFGEFCIGEKQD